MKWAIDTASMGRSGRGWMIFAVIFLLISLYSYGQFLAGIETRSGFQFQDPLLQLFPATDFTWPVFMMIYSALALVIVYLFKRPMLAVQFALSYALIIWVRMAMMWVLPLDPPPGMIALEDPIAQWATNAGQGVANQPLARDLFFSGHTATLTLVSLFAPAGSFKRVAIVTTIMVALMLLAQHVHYSVDVMVAPFVSFACYTFVRRLFHNS